MSLIDAHVNQGQSRTNACRAKRRAKIRSLICLDNKLNSWKKQQENETVDKAKAIMAHDVSLQCPDPNQPFDVETDASDCQLGSVTSQNNQPAACFSCKLTPAQCEHPTVDKEMLSICGDIPRMSFITMGSSNPCLCRSQKSHSTQFKE